MTKNILCDYHHGALYYSFHLLFEKRLGWNLFRPIGYSWFKTGFWRYSRNPQVIKQYLKPPQEQSEDKIYHITSQEGTNKYVHKAITFKKFLELDFDYIIASVKQHEQPFHKLAEMKGAAFIRQLGNPNEVCNFNICRNILNSTTHPVASNLNQVNYHPEFSLEDYCYTMPSQHKTIKNFMNCLPHSVDAPLWYQYEKGLPDFTFKMHGILGRDGLLPVEEVPKAMREASWIWHLKSQGDGYGFVCFQSYACGRPMIVKKHYYKGQMAEPLFEDSVTCIDLDLGSLHENVQKIRYWSQPENHIHMCENAYERFKQYVDFDREFTEIKKFLAHAKKEGEI